MRSRVQLSARAVYQWAGWWPCLTILASLVPVHGLFTTSRIFHVRDLSMFFWPRHLWLRDVIWSGSWPIWDPYTAGGQPAFSDPLNQLFFPPALVLRLLPEIIGFNLWVALPLPIAAAGAYLLFRTRVSRPAASLGALVFAYAGPVVSTLLYPNLSWVVALMPWVVWLAERCVERGGRRTHIEFAGALALLALAGEPVTLTATLVLAAAYVATLSAVPMLVVVRRLLPAGTAGMLLAAVQLVPMGMAAVRSPRAQYFNDGTWSLHPLAALELVVPYVFGNTYDAPLTNLPWVGAFNRDADPLFYSIYLGVGALTVAFAALLSRERRWVRFWTWTLLAAVVAAMGEHSVPYRILQSVVTPLEGFRFPVKYLTVGALAAGALVAVGFQALMEPAEGVARNRTRMLILVGSAAAVPFVLGLALLSAPGRHVLELTWLALTLDADRLGQAVGFFQSTVPVLLLRVSAIVACGALLLAVSTGRQRRSAIAAAGLFLMALMDPLSTNWQLNPTIPASQLRMPEWVRTMKASGDGRVYVGARLLEPGQTEYLLDGPDRIETPAELSIVDAQSLTRFQYVLVPAAWRMREVVSYDLPLLWPQEYRDTLRMLMVADAKSRWSFLTRAGVRYCLVGTPLGAWTSEMTRVRGFESLSLYECNPDARRAFVTEATAVEPDARERIARLFDRQLPGDVLVLEAPAPAPSGEPRTPGRPDAEVVVDTPRRVVTRAVTGPSGGFLTLLDTFDPDWSATVDGNPAPILRSNVLFRAVRLAPGAHLVEFRYQPRSLYLGAVISLVGALMLLLPVAPLYFPR